MIQVESGDLSSCIGDNASLRQLSEGLILTFGCGMRLNIKLMAPYLRIGLLQV